MSAKQEQVSRNDLHLDGACHCGNIHVHVRISKQADSIEVRACQCSFCRRHGAKTFTDPDGNAEIEIGDAGLNTYRFGLSVSDTLLCARCGVYIGACMRSADGRAVVTLNAQGLAINDLLHGECKRVDYSSDSAASRQERRWLAWTPAHLKYLAD